MTAAPRTPSVGDGRYTLTARIATGGMGEVWRARDTVLGREVAVKILKPEYADDDTFLARFQAEARNTASLHDPGIAQVFDFGDVSEAESPHATAFLVMELVPGEPLSAVLAREGALAPDRAADLVAQAAAAIEVAHRRGIVHRDVKPANLMVTPDGVVKVTDFGIARAGDAVPLTHTGEVIGTAHYLSPEQAEGKPATPASDIYSLGVVLYECLRGRRPFVADAPVAVAMAHVREPAPPLPDSVPARLADLCLHALAKDPAGRPASSGELAAGLRDPGSAVPPAAATATAEGIPEHTALLTTPAGAPAGSAAGAGTRRRPAWLVPVLAAAAVLVLIGTTALGLVGADESRQGDGAAGGDPASSDHVGPSPVASSATGGRAGDDGGRAGGDGGAAPRGVEVNPGEYQGVPYPDARADLEAAGLAVRRTDRVGTDGEPGTVAYVQPHGVMPVGSPVTLGVWEQPSPPPTPEEVGDEKSTDEDEDEASGDEVSGDGDEGSDDDEPGKGKGKAKGHGEHGKPDKSED